MKIEQILQTYDATYAAQYDETFLKDVWNKESVAFQLRILGDLLQDGSTWLDVACGTGWVLSQFPEVQRAGLDISGPMLDVARGRNPGVEFVQRNFRDPYPDWNDKWDLVSCMWWAYCLAETMSEIRQHVARLADWTAPTGKVFLPLCDPQKFDRHNIRIPYIDPKVPGRVMITGITWTWIQDNGKRHEDALSPQVDHLVAMFRQHFNEVKVIEGPLDVLGEGWLVQGVLIAEDKKPIRREGDLYPPSDQQRPGYREWLLGTDKGNLAKLSLSPEALERARVTIDYIEGEEPWVVQLNRIGFAVEMGHLYRLSFRVRSECPRPFAFGVAKRDAPFSGLGAYRTVTGEPEWGTHILEFEATEDSDRARVHFDLGQSQIPIEFEAVDLAQIR